MKSRLLDRARMTEDADTGRESRKIQAVLYSAGARLSEIQAEMLADLSRCAAAKGLKVAGFETPEPATAGKFSEITVVMRLSGDARSCVELLKDIRDNKKTLIVIAGNFQPTQIIAKIYALMKNVRKGEGGKKFKTNYKQKEPAVLIQPKNTDQNHLVLAARTFNCFDKRRYILSVLSTILGGGMSSRLFQRIRDEMGAAYYIHSFTDLSLDHGF